MFTLKQIQELKDKGLIRDFVDDNGSMGATKKPKYGNRKTEIDGIVFDSVKEAKRYIGLRYLQQAWEISELKLQVPFELNVGGGMVAKYVADFTYMKNGELVVEDVKSSFTRKLAVYRLKKKLMKQIHGIEIKEV